jgi:hypothetical protein
MKANEERRNAAEVLRVADRDLGGDRLDEGLEAPSRLR